MPDAMLNTTPDAAERLADHALALRWDQVPHSTRVAARAFLYDTLAVGAAGRNAVHAESILSMVTAWGTGNDAGVLGRPGLKLPAPSAAFLNAFQIHGQEYDCVHEPAVLHPMATVLAAVLAEAERGAAVSGAALLTALIAGVDVAVTLGIAAPGPLKFFRPATAGIYGCVAAITNLRAMPREQVLDAFGHALAFTSGTMQAHVEGKPALPVQVANAARASLIAVDLARAGMAGVRGTFEGPFGYFALLEAEDALAPALKQLGQGHRIDEVSWKPFPTGRAGHGGIAAVQQMMREQGLSAETLDHLEYRAPPLIHRLVGRLAYAGMAPGYARLCMQWLAAVTLLKGKVSLEHFGQDMLEDPDVLALAARITVVNDGTADPSAFVPAIATARLKDGQELQQPVTAQFGSPTWPLTQQDQWAKAHDCLTFAGLSPCHAALTRVIAEIDSQDDAISAIRATGIMG